MNVLASVKCLVGLSDGNTNLSHLFVGTSHMDQAFTFTFKGTALRNGGIRAHSQRLKWNIIHTAITSSVIVAPRAERSSLQ